MTLRGRITVTAAIAVALGVILASVAVYLVAARALHREVDQSLSTIARELVSGPSNRIFEAIRRDGVRTRLDRDVPFGPRRDALGGAGGFVQVLDAHGEVLLSTDADDPLPVSEAAGQVSDTRHATTETITHEGHDLRVLTTPVGRHAALQVARPVDEVTASLARLRRLLLLVGVAGVGAAAAAGWVIGRRAVRPVAELTDAAEAVTATQDLSHRIDVTGNDELARLATTFNQMLASLEQARDAQEQLIADASHELRTPLTSLRTNIEVLSSGATLSAADRRALANDVVTQLDEFGHLVSGLVELARGDIPVTAMTPMQLDEVVEEAVARTRLHHPDAMIEVDAEACSVHGDRTRIERAVGNLVTNAVVHGGGTPVTVHVGGGVVTVRDAGPGVPEEDLPHVADRFYRAPDARSQPGSGLGLAIVDQTARAHGGGFWIRNHPDGGAEASLSLP